MILNHVNSTCHINLPITLMHQRFCFLEGTGPSRLAIGVQLGPHFDDLNNLLCRCEKKPSSSNLNKYLVELHLCLKHMWFNEMTTDEFIIFFLSPQLLYWNKTNVSNQRFRTIFIMGCIGLWRPGFQIKAISYRDFEHPLPLFTYVLTDMHRCSPLLYDTWPYHQ